jgi:hypothetical protein
MRNSQGAEEQLASFMAKYTPEIISLAKAIRARMREVYPTALELVYDNYNALAIGFAPSERTSEAIFSVVLYPKWVSFFFLQARGLPDPDKILRGNGAVCKHIVLPSLDALNSPAVRTMMREAEVQAKVPFDPKGVHRLIIKSISKNQRPRRPAGKDASQAARAGIRSKKASASARAL